MKTRIYLPCVLALIASYSAFSAPENAKVVEVSKGIKIISKVKDFQANAHKVTLCQADSERSGGWACVIDGKPTFGVVSAEATNKIEAIRLIDGKREINLDVSGMYYGPGRFFIVKNDPWLILRGCFGDGVATYTAEWLVMKGHSVRTLLRAYEESPRELDWCEKAK